MSDDLTLKGRHALVCGASKGIGRATALLLARRGAKVTALARSKADLDDVVARIRGEGGRGQALVADLDDRDALGPTIDALLAGGPVHIWVNNTGGPPGGPLTAATEAELLAALGRHLLAAHAILQRVLPGMRQEGYGRIVSVLSISVREPLDGLGVSNLTRAAVASWCKTLSRELPPGITINNVLPGFTDTERLASLARARAEREGVSVEAIWRGFTAAIPEGRLARPEETAQAIAFLASEAAACIRGHSLPVDGGTLRCL